jgi:hypothetical protein
MLEPLAGRLKWEKTIQGIRVAIPVSRNTFALLYGPLVLAWIVIASIHYWHVLMVPHPDDDQFTLQMIAMLVYAIGICFFLIWLAFTFTGETVLFLDSAELNLQRRVLGIEVASRSFPAGQVKQLIYISPHRMAVSRSIIDPNSSKIQFRTGNGMHSFAKGITESEARALIQAMIKANKLPNI